MAKRLYLLRHAKSSWKDSELADHERPLARRGRRAAKEIARHLNAQDAAIALVLCSTAQRARETFARIEPALGAPTVRYEPELYRTSADALLGRLRRVPDEVAAVMLVGHSPEIEQLARALAGRSSERGELDGKFPTAALATLEFRGTRWRDLDRDGAELVSVVRPRDLEPGG